MAKRKDSERITLAVEDFGPIAEATVELRPFTVFVGASNTGKSYLAILLYALHRFFGAGPTTGWHAPHADSDASTEQLVKTISTFLEQLLEAIGSKPSVDVELPEHVAALVRSIMEDVDDEAPLLDAEIARCFGVETQSLIRQSGGKSARIALRRELDRTSANGPDLSYHFNISRSQPQLTASIARDMPLRIQSPLRAFDAAFALTHAHVALAIINSRRSNLRPLANLVVPYALGTMAQPIHYLPADRAGVMHAHRVVVSSLIGRASRAGIGAESPLPTLSGVLADFLNQLIDLGNAEQGAGAGRQFAERLETDILRGAVRTHRSAVGYPSFHYRPTDWKRDLPLMNTSSMVSELAPVVLYLRHIVQPGDVLIIEEPESHLHPAMQVAFTRQLAAVVRSGVRVVLTTHSEWVLEALANLVRLSDVDKSRRQEIAGDDLALTPDQVGAWLFEQKRRPKGSVVKEIPLDVRRGTFPAGFGEITEQLYNDFAGITNLVAEQGE